MMYASTPVVDVMNVCMRPLLRSVVEKYDVMLPHQKNASEIYFEFGNLWESSLFTYIFSLFLFATIFNLNQKKSPICIDHTITIFFTKFCDGWERMKYNFE